MCGSDIFLGILAILFPPLPVWIKRGICSADSLINLALCVLGFLPGLIHAWYIISLYPEPTYDELAQQDPERGAANPRVTYYYIAGAGAAGANAPQQQGYGTVQPAQAQDGQYQSQDAMAQGQQGGSSEQPPAYQDAVRGDNKVQSRD